MDELDLFMFEKGIKRLLERFDQIDKKLEKLLTKTELDKDIQVLDNQDLCMMLRVSRRTLQRYRQSGILPSFIIKGKNYYKLEDVKKFIAER